MFFSTYKFSLIVFNYIKILIILNYYTCWNFYLNLIKIHFCLLKILIVRVYCNILI